MGNHKAVDMVAVWKKEVLDNRGRDAECTLKNCLKIEDYARKNDDAELLGFAYFYRGETYYILNDAENMFRYMASAIHPLDESGQWNLIARAYNLMAITSINKGNASTAMDYYLAGLSYCRKYHLDKMESSINLNLGNLYMQNGVYHEAQRYFERAYRYYANTPTEKNNIVGLTAVYSNLARCHMLLQILNKAGEYIQRLDRECASYFEDIDFVYVGCIKARYYHMIGDEAQRDFYIDEIEKKLGKGILLMDIFDDLYDFCCLMLEIDRDEVLWDIIDRLEGVIKNSGVINLQRKLVTLKIREYRKMGDNAGYLQASGLYFELSEIMEREERSMISNMLYVRTSLERANESRRRMEAVNVQLLERSETDQLTGLANRYRLNKYSEKMLETCIQKQMPLAVEILDIDYFKQYNDGYGHQAGDNCIAAIAGELKKLEDNQTFCARYGGDEFIVIYAGGSPKEVYQKAADLRSKIMELNLEHVYSKALPVVTISQGISYGIPDKSSKSWDFLHAADMLLYKVKKKNRNDICLGNLQAAEIVQEDWQEVEP